MAHESQPRGHFDGGILDSMMSSDEILQNQVISPPTEAELREADEIIAKGIARAQQASHQSPETIWQRFDMIRQQMADGVNRFGGD